MIRRLHVHNYRCLENFNLPLAGQSSVLLIGDNGSGKTTVSFALEVLQKIARGTNRVGDLVQPKDFAWGRAGVPMRFEIEVELGGIGYLYSLALELPDGFRELRVMEEKLEAGGKPVFTRERAQVDLHTGEHGAAFGLDWHLVALPIVQERAQHDPIAVFRRWLAQVLILRPIPRLITGDSTGGTLQPAASVSDFGAWFTGLLAFAPSAYSKIEAHLRQLMPDIGEIKNPEVARDARSLMIQFTGAERSLQVPFGDLSDGEKCFMICALVLASAKVCESLVCFWDEPDAHLALSEVGHFVAALRKAFDGGAQFIMTSHDEEAIRRFSDENTLVFERKSHFEPTVIRRLDEIPYKGDLIGALIRGDLPR